MDINGSWSAFIPFLVYADCTVLVQMSPVQANYIRQILEHAKAPSLGNEQSDASWEDSFQVIAAAAQVQERQWTLVRISLKLA